jgi:2'-phosphotransferase
MDERCGKEQWDMTVDELWASGSGTADVMQEVMRRAEEEDMRRATAAKSNGVKGSGGEMSHKQRKGKEAKKTLSSSSSSSSTELPAESIGSYTLHGQHKNTGEVKRRKASRWTNMKASKLLSWALRHGAAGLGLTVRSDGFVAVDALLAALGRRAASIGLTPEVVRCIVSECPKQRFMLVEEPVESAAGTGAGTGTGTGTDTGTGTGTGTDVGVLVLYIRANQGHTITSVHQEELLRPLLTATDVMEAGPVVVHGTQVKYWAGPTGISTRGLSTMGRQHVHFATGLPHEHGGKDRVRSGMRKGCSLLVYLDPSATLAAGLPLFLSANGVVLCPGNEDGCVPPELFMRVVDVRSGTELPLPPLAAVNTAAAAVNGVHSKSSSKRGGAE